MPPTMFRGNRPAGSGEEDFKSFLPYLDMAAILVMLPASCHQIFISLYLKAFIKNWFRSAQQFLRKSGLNFCMYTTLGQGQEMTFTYLQYSHSFIYSIRCLLLPIFRSLAAIVSEKSTVFTFSYRKV